jgi:hypothetical protein
MSDPVTQAVIASAIGVAFTVLARLVDRFLPDPRGEHPLPPPPSAPPP